MRYLEYILPIIIFLLIVVVFKNWFLSPYISGGDFSIPYINIEEISLFPSVWFSTGLGYNGSYLLSGFPLTFLLILLSKMIGFSIAFSVKFIYFYLFISFSIISSFLFFRKLFNKKEFAFLSSSIFLFNTYILMIVGGGQMGIAMAYAMTPLVLAIFIKLLDSPRFSSLNFKFQISNFKLSLLAGLLLSILVFFDLRIAYVCMTAVMLYLVLSIKYEASKNNLLSIFNLIFYSLIIPGAVTFLLNSFWIIPLISGGKNPLVELGNAYSSLESVKFFSFAKFEDSLSLFHPNWPENIFGKTGFLKPEFLLLPIFAFSSLLFINGLKSSKERIYVLYFALLGLIGAFLAKGANDPFGGIYLWLFDHFPGFMMFRDPTKWYVLVAVSYSILIPYSVWNIYGFLKSKIKNQKSKIYNLQNLFLIFTILYLLFLIRPALLGQLTGTFKTTTVPDDYLKLEQFLSSQNTFSRTLWIPTQQRFGFYSNLHPAIPAQDFFKTTEYTNILKNVGMSRSLLQESAVKYVVVPYDSQGEIFLKDRKYDNRIYQETINNVSKIPYLKRINGFGKIAVFEAPNPRDHFWTTSSSLSLKYQYISPVEYKIEVKNAKKGDTIIFSESYDARWIAKSSELRVQSSEFDNKFNSFVLPKNGNYELEIYYTPQDYVNIGLAISVVTLFSSLLALTLLIIKKKKI